MRIMKSNFKHFCPEGFLEEIIASGWGSFLAQSTQSKPLSGGGGAGKVLNGALSIPAFTIASTRDVSSLSVIDPWKIVIGPGLLSTPGSKSMLKINIVLLASS